MGILEKGGLGTVWKVKIRGNLRALKVLHMKKNSDECKKKEIKEKFIKEVERLLVMNYENVV